MGLPDDCDELQTLRAFRDQRKEKDPAFADLVREYYAIAPQIVDCINNSGDSGSIYLQLYKELVVPCVQLIKQDREEEAISLYTGHVRRLQKTYGVVYA